MEEYASQFRRYGIIVAQMLLNRDDMDDRRRYLNARHALVELLARSVVPIINENDCVTVDELKFGDNDMLSAMIAAKMDADLLIIMSNIPGLMTAHPSKPEAKLIPVVERVTPEHEALVDRESSAFGTGGMQTKLMAARHATQFGVTTVMVDGMKEGKIDRIMTGKFEGTLFLPTSARRSGSSRRHWLSSVRPRGAITVDEGAAKALICDGKSLLAVGIVSTDGEYTKGDVVTITDKGGREIAHGEANYDMADVLKIMGKKGPEIAAILGEVGYTEVVHRNNMVILAES
jgi:glutamate 5-kinase